MQYEIACACGHHLQVSEDMAGSAASCPCGNRVPVPRLSERRAPDGAAPATAPVPVPEPSEGSSPPPQLHPFTEILAPMQAVLRTQRGHQREQRERVMVALTPDALWVQDAWRLRSIPLHDLRIEAGRTLKELVLAVGPESAAEKLMLTFDGAAQGEHWYKQIQAQQLLTAHAPPSDRHLPEGVALVRRAPDVPQATLEPVAFTGQTQWSADRGLQLRAGIRGADAVVKLRRQKCPEAGWGARHVSGWAVRVEDADARKRLRMRWYAEEVGTLVRRMVLLVIVQAALLFVVAAFGSSVSPLQQPTGKTPSEAFAAAGWGLTLLYTWPIVLLILLWVLRWPALLRAAGLAVVAVTPGRWLSVALAHLLAVRAAGVTAAEGKVWMLVDPVEWAMGIAGVALCVRAWRQAREARQILPLELQAQSVMRQVTSRGLLAVTGAYALLLLGVAGMSRYRASAYLLQPGIDPRREREALLALNTGAAQANKGDPRAAERSLEHALKLWQELTAGRPAPSAYRRGLATTLYDLGWLRHKQGRLNEAESYYARAVALGDELAGDPPNAEFKETMNRAREALADLRDDRSSKALDEKDKVGVRKYEEGQVKAHQGPAEAERLYREAIGLWEEVLRQATDEDYRKSAVARLATAYLRLGELQKQQAKRPAAEASLKKAIDYGERAVALQPGRVLTRHNLDVARQMLEELREHALQEEITKLCSAERFADAVDLYRRGIEEQEEQVRSGKDREAATRRLAYRLDRFAWFLAHCPDDRVRDEKSAIKHARRATQLQPDVGEYWYSLAMVQYRKGDWQDSLASLEMVKAKDGGWDASDWFLSAMNLHRLKRPKEARAALRKGVEWMDETKRQAEDNTLMRLRFEMMRPGIEALQKEAENLIEGKDPTNEGVG